MENGLFQGSTISPLLLNIHENDIHNIWIQSKIFQCADDAWLYIIHENKALIK